MVALTQINPFIVVWECLYIATADIAGLLCPLEAMELGGRYGDVVDVSYVYVVMRLVVK